MKVLYTLSYLYTYNIQNLCSNKPIIFMHFITFKMYSLHFKFKLIYTSILIKYYV